LEDEFGRLGLAGSGLAAAQYGEKRTERKHTFSHGEEKNIKME
jgi:hypothetical protein